MLMRRLKVYPLMRRIAEPPATCYCARCFASLLLNQARAWVRILVRFPGFACLHTDFLAVSYVCYKGATPRVGEIGFGYQSGALVC